MSVFRKRVTKANFTVVQNELLYDPAMSAKTKWLIIYCLSKPDGWDFASHRIARETKDGRDAILSAMKEARTSGWMKVYNVRQPDGSLQRTTEVTDSPWDFSTHDPDIGDSPESENPTSVNPTPDAPTSANPDSKKELISSITDGVRTEEPTVCSSSSPLSSITADGPTVIQPPSAPPLSHPSHTATDPSEAAAITPGPDGDSTVRPGSTGRPPLGEQVRQVYEVWVEVMGKNAGAKLNDKRRSKIEARLREQYTVEELIAAIKGARANPWMMGDNERGTPYNDIVTILRDGATVEKHRDYVPQGKTLTPMEKLRERQRQLEEAS